MPKLHDKDVDKIIQEANSMGLQHQSITNKRHDKTKIHFNVNIPKQRSSLVT